jgi:hypothetical protein
MSVAGDTVLPAGTGLCWGSSLSGVARSAIRMSPGLFDMEVIVRRQDHPRCASITCMIRHYVARRAQVSAAPGLAT